LRKCNRCEEEKEDEDFHSGAYQCKRCKSAYDKRRREKKGEEIKKAKREYYSRPDVKSHKKEYDKAYRQKNRDWIDSRRAEWAIKNREKCKRYALTSAHKRRSKTQGGASSEDLKEWSDKQEKVCHWCGCNCEENFEIDHYLPIALGGEHETYNFVISCMPCNRKKHAQHPAEFAASIGRLL